MSINFVPFIDTLITPWMDNYSKKNSNKKLYNLLEGLLNTKLIDIILKVSNIDGNRYYKDLSNDEKLVLCKNLKGLKINNQQQDETGFTLYYIVFPITCFPRKSHSLSAASIMCWMQ